jgi:transposase
MTIPKPSANPIEVITSIQRRRRWAAEEKRAIVEEAEQLGASISSVARKYGINPNQLFHWRRLIRQGSLSAVRADEEVVPVSEVKQLRARLRELERLLGKKTMEAEILKEALELSREKKLLLRMPLLDREDSR